MKILYIKSKWEMWDDSLDYFLNRVQKDNFDGTELYFDSVSNTAKEIRQMHENANLFLVGQILTDGDKIADHIESFKRQADFSIEAGSKVVNVHAGRDFFAFDDNVKLIEEIIKYAEQSGIDFFIETHRGRLTYSLIETVKFLNEFPEMKLTADFSHWMVVHESDLSNQAESLQLAIDHSYHIHARVGYEEGPQVTDPSAPEWGGHLKRHLKIWNEIVGKRKTEGAEIFIITPEFGPPNYMHTLPLSNKPVRDTWEINLLMREILKEKIIPRN